MKIPQPHCMEQCLYLLLVSVEHILHNLGQGGQLSVYLKATNLSYKMLSSLDTWCRKSGNVTEGTVEYPQTLA